MPKRTSESGYDVLTKTIPIAVRLLRPDLRTLLAALALTPLATALTRLALALTPLALIPLALVLLAGSAAHAQEPRVSLSVKPGLCITDNREQRCALSIQVTWRSTRAGNYCLHNDLATAALRCWELAEGGMLVEDRVVQDTFQYFIVGGGSSVRLAEARLDVMTADSEDRRRNRQRRHVWDIL